MKNIPSLSDMDRVIHEPARLQIMAILYSADQADFLFLLHQTSLTKGNLSAHLSKLEGAGYVNTQKTFRGKIPQSLYSLTQEGRQAFDIYRQQMRKIINSN